MIAYIGQTRSRSLIARLSAWGFGEMTNRGEAPPRRLPFALDNGAYKDSTAGADFDEAAFLADLQEIETRGLTPDFVVAPDRVAAGLESLAFSLSWVPRLSRWAERLYLVVQDGMNSEDVLPHLSLFAGLFVGGSLEWKIKTGEAWVRFAHAHELPCHIGRVGTTRRVSWAKRIGADSIDSCLPLWCEKYLQNFVMAVQGAQPDLWSTT